MADYSREADTAGEVEGLILIRVNFNKGTKMKTVTQGLSLVFDALVNQLISNIEAKRISNCLDDFTKLQRLQLRYWKKTGDRSDAKLEVPDIGLSHMMDLFNSGDYASACVEADRIRNEMKPILQQAREKMKA